MDKLVVEPLFGFGDHLYLRPLLAAAAETTPTYVSTAYPELYRGTGVHCMQPEIGYSFSDFHRGKDWEWVERPARPFKYIRNMYTVTQLRSGQTISDIISMGFEKKVFDKRYPATAEQMALGKALIGDTGGKPVLLVKMPAYSSDWKPTARSPKFEYLIHCLDMARTAGFFIVSTHAPKDKFVEDVSWERFCDKLVHEELSIDQIVGLFGVADRVLSGPNFTIPLCASMNKPLFTVFGGHVRPDLLVDPRMRFSNWRYAAPNPFCNCVKNTHDCNKGISYSILINRFDEFLKLNPVENESQLTWHEDRGYGYFPVDNTGVYNDEYFDKYVGYEHTPVGGEITNARVRIARKYQCNGRILDVGIGSGQFLRAVGGLGFDVCPKAIEYLKQDDSWRNPWTDDLWDVDVITFFDSFEHEQDIDGLMRAIDGRTLILSIPIFKDKAHVLRSKHFRKDEHFHYFTREGLLRWMRERNYYLEEESRFEEVFGREDIGTFVFRSIPLNERLDLE